MDDTWEWNRSIEKPQNKDGLIKSGEIEDMTTWFISSAKKIWKFDSKETIKN